MLAFPLQACLKEKYRKKFSPEKTLLSIANIHFRFHIGELGWFGRALHTFAPLFIFLSCLNRISNEMIVMKVTWSEIWQRNLSSLFGYNDIFVTNYFFCILLPASAYNGSPARSSIFAITNQQFFCFNIFLRVIFLHTVIIWLKYAKVYFLHRKNNGKLRKTDWDTSIWRENEDFQPQRDGCGESFGVVDFRYYNQKRENLFV